MNILKKTLFWALLGGVLFTALILILIPLTFPTVNTVNDPDAEEVFTRFKDKIRFTRVSRHYEELISKHSDELNEIYNAHPDHEEHRENLLQLMQIFMPVMQDLLEGDGNKVQITREQIELLQAELDWIAQVAGPALRRDVEEEWQHLPLETLVGMTFSEALDFLEADLPPELAAQPIAPTALPTLVIPTATFVPSICTIGPDIDCLAQPSILPDSNGLWAFAILDGLYFEYPADWRVETTGNLQGTTFYLIPAEESVEELKTRGVYITVRDNALSTDFPPREGAVWSQQISLADFEGQAFMMKSGDMYILQAHLYDQSRGRMVYFGATIYGEQTNNQPPNNQPPTAEIIEENVSRFKRMVESAKIAGEAEPVTQTPPVQQGAWVQEIMNGVSFEYPVEWQVKRSEGPDVQIRSFIVPADSFEGLNTKATIVGVIQNVSIPQDAALDKLSCSSDISSPQHASLWHQAVTLDDFEGSQFLWEGTNTEGGGLLYWEVVLYNREFQRMVCMATEIYPDAEGQWPGTPDSAAETLPNFDHILESIKISVE
jgi:hypothetical protein